MHNKQLYWSYSVIGILYVAVKFVFFVAGYLHLGAIWHGLVPAVLTTAAGVIGLRTTSPGPALRWTLLSLPILVLVTTPPFMYWKQGSSEWLTEGRLPVLIIYECLALLQIAIAIGLEKKTK